MGKQKKISGWQRRLEKVKEWLGEPYEQLDADLREGSLKPKAEHHFKKWLPQKKKRGLSVQLGRGIPRKDGEPKGPGIGVFVEPSAIDENGEAVGDELTLNVAVYLRIQSGPATYAEHDALVTWLEKQAKTAFPQLAKKSLTSVYSNPTPVGHPVLYRWLPGSRQSDSESVLWLGLVAPTRATLATAESDAWLELAAQELRALLGQFSAFVNFIRGAVTPRETRQLDPRVFLGWCGEYVFHAEHLDSEWTWLTGCVDDFEHGDERFEVKSALRAPPDCPHFSIGQIEHAIALGSNYHVITVGLDEAVVEELFARAQKMSTKGSEGVGNAGTEALVWPHRLATNVGVPFAVAVRDLATDQQFIGGLRRLRDSARIEPIEPNPFCTEAYEPLRGCVERQLLCGRIAVKIAR